MSRAVVILSLATAIFAASTIYLAADKYLRDNDGARGPPLAAAQLEAPQREATIPQLTNPSGDTRAGASATAPGAADLQPADTAAASPAAKQDMESEGTLFFARQFLARYDDSVQRAALLDETTTGIRRQYGKLKELLKLSDATFEQLVTLLAEETLQIQEQYTRCAVDPQCNANEPSRPTVHVDRSQEVLALLGTAGADSLNQFRGSIGERDQVIQLRGRLSDSNLLPEAQAERLIKALAAERKLYQQESAQRGVNLNGWGTQLGMLFFSKDSGSVDQQIAEAEQYSERMRGSAASVLTPAQLSAYEQMQDELLAQLAAWLRPPARKGSSAPARST